MKFIKPSLLSIPLALLLSCGDKQQSVTMPETKQSHAVQWYSGYTMPELLAESVTNQSKAELGTLLEASWYAPFTVMPEGTTQALMLNSCTDYFKANTKPLRLVQEKDVAPFMEIALMCQATRAMVDAAPAKNSSPLKLSFDENLPARLPAAVAMVISTSERNRMLENQAIKNWSQVNQIESVSNASAYHATYKHSGGIQELTLTASADFNHDGTEDFLISSRDSVDDGSYSAIRMFIITSKPGAAHFVLLDELRH